MDNSDFHTQLQQNNHTYNSLTLLIKLALNCGLSAFYYGYSLTYFNSIHYHHIISIFHLENYPRALTQGLLTASTCFTAAIGTLLTTRLIAHYSRRQSLMLLGVISIFVTLLTLIPCIYTLILARVCQGLLIGNISSIGPLYIREMIPKEVSGSLWSLHQILFVIGTAFGFMLTLLLGLFSEPTDSWRLIFGFPLLSATLQQINFRYFFTFDTPKWYIMKNNKAAAIQVIELIYQPSHRDKILKQLIQANKFIANSTDDWKTRRSQIAEAQVELEIMEAGSEGKVKDQKPEQHKNIDSNSLAIFTALFLIGQQPFLGSMITQQYCNEISLKTFPSMESLPVVINLVGIIGSIYSIELMRKCGRRDLIIKGVFICLVCNLLCLFFFWDYNILNVQDNSFLLRIILLLSILLIRITLSSAVGPVPWLYIAEIVQPHIIPWCSLMSWIILGINSTIFPILCEMKNGNPSLAFLMFSSVTMVGVMIDKKILIQTKNKTELQIHKQYEELCQQIKPNHQNSTNK